MADADYDDLKVSLEWGATLELTDDQRRSLTSFCSTLKLAAVGFSSTIC